MEEFDYSRIEKMIENAKNDPKLQKEWEKINKRLKELEEATRTSSQTKTHTEY